MLILLFSLLFTPAPSHAHSWNLDRCTVTSPSEPELTEGVNRDAICLETVFALKKQYESIPEGYALKISAKTESRNTVMLWVEWATPFAGDDYTGRARLFWSQDGRWVEFLDKP